MGSVQRRGQRQPRPHRAGAAAATSPPYGPLGTCVPPGPSQGPSSGPLGEVGTREGRGRRRGCGSRRAHGGTRVPVGAGYGGRARTKGRGAVGDRRGAGRESPPGHASSHAPHVAAAAAGLFK